MARRKSYPSYEENVLPKFADIKRWAELGASDKEIWQNLGICSSTFYKYKSEHSELMELIKKARRKPILEIKNALYRRALGFQYTEKKVIRDALGYEKVEEYTRSALPDPTSAMMLLKHWDKEGGWTNDPQILELRKKELKLKEKQIDKGDW